MTFLLSQIQFKDLRSLVSLFQLLLKELVLALQ